MKETGSEGRGRDEVRREKKMADRNRYRERI